MSRRWVALVVTALAAAVAVAVGPAAGAANAKRFCNAYKTFNVFNGHQFDVDAPTPEEAAAIQPQVDRLVDAFVKPAPGAIADDVAIVADRFHASIVLEETDPEAGAALHTVDAWAVAHCGYKVVDVTADEFTLTGIPKRLKTGFVAFRFTNRGAEAHWFGVVRFKGAETVDELLALTEAEARARVEPIASGVQADAGGGQIVNWGELAKPGRYLAFDPDFVDKDMYVEFTVAKR